MTTKDILELSVKIQSFENTIFELCNAQLKSIAFGCSYDINVDTQIKELTQEMLRATETFNNNTIRNIDSRAKDVII